MTVNIDQDVLRAGQPTRGQDAKRLTELANGPLRRRDCVCLGDRGYLPDSSSEWDSREYRKRWQIESFDSGVTEWSSVCAPTRQRETTTYEVVLDLAPVYHRSNNDVIYRSDLTYSERLNKGVKGGVIVSVTLEQWDSGSLTTVGSVASEAFPVTYALPDSTGSSRLLFNQYHCIREGADSGFAYQEGFSPFSDPEVFSYQNVIVPVDLNGSFNAEKPTDITVEIDIYQSDIYGTADTGLNYEPYFKDEIPEGIPSIDGDPDDAAFTVHVLGWSVWAVGGQ